MAGVSQAKASLDLEEAQRAVLKVVWKREGENLVFDPASLDTPLSRVLEGEDDIRRLSEDLDPEHRAIIEERVGMAVQELLFNARNRALQVLLDWIFGDSDGPLPRKVLKRLYAFVRVFSPDHVWCMSQTDLGELFGEGRSANNAREKDEVEVFMRIWYGEAFTVNMGGKSAGARANYAKLRTGNHCRKGGKSVDYLFENGGEPPAEDKDGDFPKRKGVTRRMIAALANDEERRRIAKLAGVRPRDIDLKKTFPARDEFPSAMAETQARKQTTKPKRT